MLSPLQDGMQFGQLFKGRTAILDILAAVSVSPTVQGEQVYAQPPPCKGCQPGSPAPWK